MSEASIKVAKPLGGRAYGSTPHLPGSRLGPGDWTIHEGQARICTERARDKHDVIWITEKVDGSCCAVARIGHEIHPLTRAGYPAESSPFAQHHRFAEWVRRREPAFRHGLADGERIAGEWMLQAHGSRYDIITPEQLFVPFALLSGRVRLPLSSLYTTCEALGLRGAHVYSKGPPVAVEEAFRAICNGNGMHGCQEAPEGLVYVVERRGNFDFAAKWVRPDKVDGKYLPEISGGETVWNWPGGLA